jgi:hypothetical protein
MPSRKRHTERVTRADEEFERAMFYEYREENAETWKAKPSADGSASVS